jgi:hypothetical protein
MPPLTPGRSRGAPAAPSAANEQVDKIMAALRWDNEFYRAQSKAVLLRVLRSLNETGLPYSLDDVLAAAARGPPDDRLRRAAESTRADPRSRGGIPGWSDRLLRVLDTSEFPAYSPPLQDREPSTGLDLRRRAARRGSSSAPPVAPATLVFEGA